MQTAMDTRARTPAHNMLPQYLQEQVFLALCNGNSLPGPSISPKVSIHNCPQQDNTHLPPPICASLLPPSFIKSAPHGCDMSLGTSSRKWATAHIHSSSMHYAATPKPPLSCPWPCPPFLKIICISMTGP